MQIYIEDLSSDSLERLPKFSFLFQDSMVTQEEKHHYLVMDLDNAYYSRDGDGALCQCSSCRKRIQINRPSDLEQITIVT